MTNLKKLKVINLFILFCVCALTACAKVPFKGLFTDEHYQVGNYNETPIVVFHQDDLKSPILSSYLQITKNKLPEHKIFIYLNSELDPRDSDYYQKYHQYFDGYILGNPVTINFELNFFKHKMILNSGIIDIETDDYYLSPLTKNFGHIDFKSEKYALLSNLNQIDHINSDNQNEREFKYYPEDPLLNLLKIRKDLRKSAISTYLIVGDPQTNNNIRERTHQFLIFKTIPKPSKGYFSLGENLIKICPYFFKATEDCYENELNDKNIAIEILKERKKISENNIDKIPAKFLGSEILTTN